MPREPLTDEERAILESVGLRPAPPAALESAKAEVNASLERLVASSLSIQEAAQRFHVDASLIRARLCERTLYGFRREGEWWIPLFQFEGADCLPHLGEVVNALRRSLHPLAVETWFTRSHVDLADEELDRNLSPREWLLLGRDLHLLLHIATHVR